MHNVIVYPHIIPNIQLRLPTNMHTHTHNQLQINDERYGITFPVSISYNRIPTLHQSASLLWPLASRISGAMYSTVPQKELDLPNSLISFDSPKSVSMTYTGRANIKVE